MKRKQWRAHAFGSRPKWKEREAEKMPRYNECCPVCGMKINKLYFPTELHKIYYHFCSEQCRDTFQNHPYLYTGKLAKQQGEIIKHRKLCLAGTIESELQRKLLEQLHTLMGIKKVSLRDKQLDICYDLLQLNLTQIVNKLDDLQVPLSSSWWQRYRRASICQAEQNELDNITAPTGVCCNRPPPRA